jgi:hypothetical protein
MSDDPVSWVLALLLFCDCGLMGWIVPNANSNYRWALASYLRIVSPLPTTICTYTGVHGVWSEPLQKVEAFRFTSSLFIIHFTEH